MEGKKVFFCKQIFLYRKHFQFLSSQKHRSWLRVASNTLLLEMIFVCFHPKMAVRFAQTNDFKKFQSNKTKGFHLGLNVGRAENLIHSCTFCFYYLINRSRKLSIEIEFYPNCYSMMKKFKQFSNLSLSKTLGHSRNMFLVFFR